MKTDEHNNLIAESEADFRGFKIIYIEWLDQRTRRVWVEKDGKQYAIFSDVQYTKNLKEEK